MNYNLFISGYTLWLHSGYTPHLPSLVLLSVSQNQKGWETFNQQRGVMCLSKLARLVAI